MSTNTLIHRFKIYAHMKTWSTEYPKLWTKNVYYNDYQNKIKKLANRGGVGDCWPLQRKHAGSTKPYQGLSNHILSLLRLSSIMLGPRGKSRDNPGHFQPLHLQSFPRLKGVIIVKLIAFDNILILFALQLEIFEILNLKATSSFSLMAYVFWRQFCACKCKLIYHL